LNKIVTLSNFVIGTALQIIHEDQVRKDVLLGYVPMGEKILMWSLARK
jgi:hypothetical protein